MPSSPKQWDVITVGDVFTDLVLGGFAVWPRPGEESFASELRREAGGGAAITGCGLARLGCQVALLACVGRDGAWLLDRLRECGLDEALLVRSEDDSTGLTVAVSTSEDRAFFTYNGANRELARRLADPAARGTLGRARHVHLAMALDPDLLGEIAAALHEAATTLSLDVGWQTAWLQDARSLRALREVDWFMPNEREAECMTGCAEPADMLRAFADAGLPGAAIKLGARGSALLWNGATWFAEPHPVAPVDTTGAGDCFDAGFLYAWLKGLPPGECLRIANRCGALSTRAMGGVESFPTLEEIAFGRV